MAARPAASVSSAVLGIHGLLFSGLIILPPYSGVFLARRNGWEAPLTRLTAGARRINLRFVIESNSQYWSAIQVSPGCHFVRESLRFAVLSEETLWRGLRIAAIAKRSKVVVTWSGGLDTTALIPCLARELGASIFPIFIDRDQENLRKEKEAVRYFTRKFKKSLGRRFHRPFE